MGLIFGAHVVPTSNFEPLHFGLEGRSLEAQPLGCSLRAGKNPVRFAQHADDVLSFGIVKRLAGLV